LEYQGGEQHEGDHNENARQLGQSYCFGGMGLLSSYTCRRDHALRIAFNKSLMPETGQQAYETKA
jgi:hypothetical protein